MSVTSGHYGTRNDKTIVKFDSFVNNIRRKVLFAGVDFELYTKRHNGTAGTVRLVGPYLICDGGYHKWRILQDPLKHSCNYPQIRWSKWLESVRKDIERVFGILKRRFIILKSSMEYNTQKKCDNVFTACCMLHNILHAFDGYDSRWDDELDVDAAVPDAEKKEVMKRWQARVDRQVASLDKTRIGRNHFGQQQEVLFHDDVEDASEIETTNYQLKMLLVDHFEIRYAANTIRWL